MKKVTLVLFFIIAIFLTSCTKDEKIVVKNMLEIEGEYQLSVEYDSREIDIKNYVSYSKEYTVEYLDKEYSSNSSLSFELAEGENKFLISTLNEKITLKFFVEKKQEKIYNVFLLENETLSELENYQLKENESLSTIETLLNTKVIEGYSWEKEVYYSYDKVDFKLGKIDELSIENDVYIYLNLVPNKYTITYTNIDEEKVQKVTYQESFELFLPVKEGYKFLYWEYNGNEFVEGTWELLTDITLVAVFEKEKYTITYTNIDEEKVQEVTYQESFELFIPVKEGYKFLYWEYKGNEFVEGTWELLTDITLVAVFEKEIVNVILNLETFGGIVDNNSTVDSNGNIILPTPDKEEYKFMYWCKDILLTEKVDSISLSEYNNEKLYAYYEYDSENLKDQIIVTRFNAHTLAYDEVTMFDSTKSGFTSKYWHKIGITKNGDDFVISKIVANGDSITNLGAYDYVILAYTSYPGYKNFVNGNYSVGDKVKFLIDPSTLEEGQSPNIVSIIKQDISEDQKEVEAYLESLYSDLDVVESDIELVKSYGGYTITWKTSNRNAISSTGEYTKPYVTRKVILTALVDEVEIYSFEVTVKGENEESEALATGYIYTPYTITQNAMNALDIIYCAFLDIDANANWTNLTRMTNNLNNYIIPKAKISGTKVVISVNQSTSGAFGAVAGDPVLREKLATNILEFIQTTGIDGIDIDWETPTSAEAVTFTLLMEAIYNKVKAANPDYLVTAAIGGGKWAPPKYDLPNSKNYLDYINLMTYSMTSGNGYYQNSLYKSTHGATLVSCSIEESIEIYNDLGVENNQILVGVPFYTTVQTESGGPGSKTGSGKSVWYEHLYSTYKLSDTMKEYYDEECGVPYRYDEVNKIFISFDNERSIKEKCDYINTLGLAGIMYWQYGQDVDDYLSNAINKYIKE